MHAFQTLAIKMQRAATPLKGHSLEAGSLGGGTVAVSLSDPLTKSS